MDPLIIPLVALVIPIIIAPTALGIKHARFLREVEHAERMRAMELGRTLPGDESLNPAWTALAIGAGVPIVAMGIAFEMARSIHDAGSVDSIMKMTGMIGLGGVIGGTVLAAQQFARREKAARPDGSTGEKPVYDPDEFDVVASRG